MRAKPKQSIMMQTMRIRTINGYCEGDVIGRYADKWGRGYIIKTTNGKEVRYGVTGKEDSEKRGIHDR